MPRVRRVATVARFNAALFRFYRTHGRPMPWRETTDPYRILVSEIMLQQTQVSRVMKKYPLFIGAFPTAEALSRASLGDVIRHWAGLGYNRRAKYLWLAAKEVTERSDGAFPQTMEELLRLPGIGRSTGAGVMAFAYNAPEPMIDTNARRVLSRVFFPRTKKSDAELYAFAKAMIPEGKGRVWNYALLDVAATRCTARNHARDCPLAPMHGRVSDVARVPTAKRFHGSDRYYRGRVVAHLRAHEKGARLALLARAIELDGTRTKRLVEKLIHDGLVKAKGARYVLP